MRFFTRIPSNPDDKNYSYNDLLALRNIKHPCLKCFGSGVCCYPNGATWRGGMGVSKPTMDICNQCWGSGDGRNPWIDRKQLADTTWKT